MIKLIIFDLDGVLVDTETIHYDAFTGAAISVIGNSYAGMIASIPHDGRTTKQKLKALKEQLDLDDIIISSIDKLKQEIVSEKLRTEINPQLEQINMISELSQNYVLAVASNSREENVVFILEALDIKKFFTIIISGDCVTKTKPDPEIFLTVLDNLKIKPTEAIILEDSPAGISAAYDSGCNVLVVNRPENVTLEFIKNAISNLRH